MGRYSAAARRKKQKRTAHHRTFQDGPKSYLGPPRESRRPRQSGTVGMRPSERKNKTNFYVLPLPLILPSRSSSDLAAHFSRGIRHYLETPPLPDIKSTAKEGYFSLTTFPLLAGRRLLWRKERGRFHAANCPRFISKGLLVEFKWSHQGSYYRPVLLSCRFRFAITDISKNVIFSMGRKANYHSIVNFRKRFS